MKPLKTCIRCLDKQAAAHANRREKENIPMHAPCRGLAREEKGSWERPPTISWDAFLTLLSGNQDRAFELDTFVREAPREPLSDAQDSHARAIMVSNIVWEVTGYRFK
jgi:hypothetical protein